MYEIKYLFFQKRIIYISENTNNKNYRIFIRINIINCVCTYSHDIPIRIHPSSKHILSQIHNS